MPEHDLVILTSGGLDSTLLLHFSKRLGYQPVALLVAYGQKHIRELEAARKTCNKLRLPYREANVDLPGIQSGLTGNLVAGRYQGVHEAHVPGRNTIFVGLALSLAESVGATKIWIGANYEDCLNRFPDCLQQWVDAQGRATRLGASYSIDFEAPLLGMSKEIILRWAETLGIDLSEVHSGYDV